MSRIPECQEKEHALWKTIEARILKEHYGELIYGAENGKPLMIEISGITYEFHTTFKDRLKLKAIIPRVNPMTNYMRGMRDIHARTSMRMMEGLG
jgi:hypothetical protein